MTIVLFVLSAIAVYPSDSARAADREANDTRMVSPSGAAVIGEIQLREGEHNLILKFLDSGLSVDWLFVKKIG